MVEGLMVVWSLPSLCGCSSSGLWPRVLRVAPSCAVTISTYEFGKAFFQRTNGGRQ